MTRVVDILIVLVAAGILLIVALGGIDYDFGVFRFRLHDWTRPLLLLGAAGGVRAWRTGIDASFISTRGLLALLLATATLYATFHVRISGGLDSYGYVSTAALIASGRISNPQPLVGLLPFAAASSAAAPLGYVAGRDGHSDVPRFPLGLPIVMALFTIFGSQGPFFVPLLMAFGTIVLTFLLAQLKLRPTEAALFAAAIVAVDPLFAYYATQPMSDVPAVFWLLAALWLRLAQPRWPVLSGLCAGMAFLTRPALLLAAVAVGLVTIDRPRRESFRFAAALAAFVILQMCINFVLYGSVRLSGYGPASYLFEMSTARVLANVANYAKWLTHSHSLFFWLLWPGALVIFRGSRWAWQLSAVAAAAALPYVFYLVFDDWESSRFLLATIVLVLILASQALSQLSSAWGPAWMRPLLLLMIALGCAAASHRFLEREGAYRFKNLEAKYPLAGEWVRTHTPPDAVVLAALHSGSIRYYGHRETIRWDQIPSEQLSATLHNLRLGGYEPYLALDNPTEPPVFDERFRSDSNVHLEPIGRVRVVNFYKFVSVP